MSAQSGSMLYDGVFEGGGVRGIGLAGALSVFDAVGYRPYSVAGTSAGAIVSTLVASGYTAAEIKQIIMGIDFSKFEDPPLIGRIPHLGSMIDLIPHYGLYKGDYFHSLMRNLLAAKGVHTFRDLILSESAQDERYRYKARIVTSDIVQGTMVVLPTDAAKYGINPDDLDVSLAVRMSMSIPFFFYPVQQWGSYFVDGGLLSNYPLELFDSGGPPLYPTIGFLMYEPGTPRDAISLPNKINGPFTAFEAMLKTAANARDTWYMDQDKLARTVRMDSLGIQATDFQITKAQSEALFNAGVEAAQQFLAGNGQGGLAATQGDRPASVAVRTTSVSPAAPRLAAMEAPGARSRVVAPAASSTLAVDPPSNPLVWNTLAIALVSMAIIAVLGLLIAVMTGAIHLT
jgi:NTE family protein